MKVKNTPINAMGKEELATLMKRVSNDVANVIAKTYGPYGANTLIQSTEKVYATKDGWTVAQNLNYPNNGVCNALKKLIIDCMQAVLLNVGDGTSTVSLLANSIYERIYDQFIMSKSQINVKILETALNEVVYTICNELADMGTPITKSNQWDIIHNIASVATNWDKKMSNFIAEIYCKTNNPIIKFENSGSDKSYVKYINGYEIKGEMLLKDTYITDHTTGKCDIDNPIILVFGYPVDENLFETLILIANTFKAKENRELMVIAQDFQPKFISTLKALNMQLSRNNMGRVPLIPFKYYNNLNIDKDCVDDLCYLLGTEMVATDNTDVADMIKDLKESLRAKKLIDQMDTPDPKEKDTIYENCSMTMTAAHKYLTEIGGTCGNIVLTDKYLIAKDFTCAKMDIIEQRKKNLIFEIETKTKECAALSRITEGIRMKRIRLGKLQLNMGVIYVGGFGDAHLKERRDALDDATKACESVYESGYYTVGGGIAPLIAIKTIKSKDNDFTQLEKELLEIIQSAYEDVVLAMYKNKFGQNDPDAVKTSLRFINTGIDKKIAYNLITENFDKNLISPVSGEIEILKGCMSLVMVMIGANQFVYHDIQSFQDLERLSAIAVTEDVSLENAIKLNRQS